VKKVKLRKLLLVREIKAGEILILDPDKEVVHHVTKDGAKILAILSESRSQNEISLDELQRALANASSSFRRYKRKREGLIGLLQLLKTHGLLEARLVKPV
jgi:hypothetical protein